MMNKVLEAIDVSCGFMQLKAELVDRCPSREVVQKLKVLADRLDKLRSA